MRTGSARAHRWAATGLVAGVLAGCGGDGAARDRADSGHDWADADDAGDAGAAGAPDGPAEDESPPADAPPWCSGPGAHVAEAKGECYCEYCRWESGQGFPPSGELWCCPTGSCCERETGCGMCCPPWARDDGPPPDAGMCVGIGLCNGELCPPKTVCAGVCPLP